MGTKKCSSCDAHQLSVNTIVIEPLQSARKNTAKSKLVLTISLQKSEKVSRNKLFTCGFYHSRCRTQNKYLIWVFAQTLIPFFTISEIWVCICIFFNFGFQKYLTAKQNKLHNTHRWFVSYFVECEREFSFLHRLLELRLGKPCKVKSERPKFGIQISEIFL